MAIERIDRIASPPRVAEIYSDFLTNFNAHPNTGYLLKRSDIEAVKRGLRNLLLTEKGERPFNPDFGCNLRRYLFEHASDITKASIKDTITAAIENHEKRVRLVDVVVALSNDEHTYIIDVYFNVLNDPNQQNLQVKLERVR